MTASKPSKHALRASVAIVALALLAAACGSSSKPSTSPTSGGSGGAGNIPAATLTGSGSTFQQTFDEGAIAAFTQQNSQVTITYAGGGSSQGKSDLQTKKDQWAGTDSLVKSADLSKYQGGAILYFPIVSAPITLSYNLSGVSTLKLSAPTIAKIFERKITKWNDPAIAADGNTGLPNKDITVVVRSDGSGTSSNFSKFLAAAAPDVFTITPGDQPDWPAGVVKGSHNQGVAQKVQQTDGAIGYVDYSTAKASKLALASIKNATGEFVAPTLDGASKAVEAAKIESDLTYNPLNATAAGAYPITSPTWIIVYKNQTSHNVGVALKAFLSYIFDNNQTLAQQSDYAPLPDSLLQKDKAQLDQIVVPA